jgi:hypothetical protein
MNIHIQKINRHFISSDYYTEEFDIRKFVLFIECLRSVICTEKITSASNRSFIEKQYNQTGTFDEFVKMYSSCSVHLTPASFVKKTSPTAKVTDKKVESAIKSSHSNYFNLKLKNNKTNTISGYTPHVRF